MKTPEKKELLKGEECSISDKSAVTATVVIAGAIIAGWLLLLTLLTVMLITNTEGRVG
jgi:hypothetical protein